MTPEDSPQRRHARLTFQEPVSGGILTSHDVHILDLSLGGARLEHTITLRPGDTCHLRVPLKPQMVTLMGHVVWSRAVGRAADRSDGTTGLLYQSGLEFAALAGEARTLLNAFLGGEGTPPGDGRPAPRPR